MIYPGLVSVTFRNLNPSEIIGLVQKARLKSIEWGGDIHVPHGDLQQARTVYDRTIDAGISIAAYGSYYRAGISETKGLPFESVLETALELHTPKIRVWAGNKGSNEADSLFRNAVIEDLRRIGMMAERYTITIDVEYHNRTLTDTIESAADLFRIVHHHNIFSYWQPPNGTTFDHRLQSLSASLPYLSNIHVFNWCNGKSDQTRLEEGKEQWLEYFRIVSQTGRNHHALIEFVRDDTPESFLSDASALRKMIGAVQETIF
jgi:3-dehydroshikimate dehydratase